MTQEFEAFLQVRMKEIDEEIQSVPVTMVLEVPFEELCALAKQKGCRVELYQNVDRAERAAKFEDRATGNAVFIGESIGHLGATELILPDSFLGRFKDIFLGGEGAVG